MNEETELVALRTQLENERFHWGHELSETKGRLKVKVRNAEALLDDAIDCVLIIRDQLADKAKRECKDGRTPAFMKIALQRLEFTKKLLKEIGDPTK